MIEIYKVKKYKKNKKIDYYWSDSSDGTSFIPARISKIGGTGVAREFDMGQVDQIK